MRNPEDNNNRKRRTTGILIVIVLLLVVLMSAFLVLRCLTFDENGAHVIDRYGVLEMEGSSSGLVDYSRYASGGAGDAEPETADSEEQEKTTQPEKQQVDRAAPEAIRAVTVTAKDLTYDDDYRNQLLALKEQGLLDTIIVNLKNSDGWLCADVTTSVLDVSVISADYVDDFPAAIAQMKAAGIRVIGRVHCFRDDMATRQNSNLSCWYGEAGTNWLDGENHRWLDPTDSDAVQYLCDIVSAGVALGCDELVLSEFVFPAGQTELISFDQQTDAAATIQADWDRIAAAAGDVPVSLWMETDVYEASARGQDLTAMYQSVSRVLATEENAAGLSQMQDGGAKVTVVYDDRTAWKAASGSVVFDTNEDMYQIFHIE